MGAQGQTTINFGAFPGSTQASLTVTGQSNIQSTSLVEAFLYPVVATADHSIDEQILDRSAFALTISALIPGTGFTIFAQATSPLYGAYNIAWVWN